MCSVAIETAEFYSFLAAVLNNSPNESIVKKLRAYFAENGEELMEEMGEMEEFWNEHAGVSDADIARELAMEWTRLFRGLNPQLGPPPPYTGVYFSKDSTGIETIRAVQNAYNAEGLMIGDYKHDRYDYLGFELEFMAHLAKQAAVSEENNDVEKAKIYKEKLDSFAKEFVSPWISDFVDKALLHTKTSFFKGYLKLLNEFANI